MKWHVITRLGTSDAFDPGISRDVPRINVALERHGDNGLIGHNVFNSIQRKTGRFPSPVVTDLLHLAFSVFSADLLIPRKQFEDGWTRELVIYQPVTDVGLWRALTPHLSRMLFFLTGDLWEFQPRAMAGFQYPLPKRPRKPTVANVMQSVNLFSGGIDSLVGAIDLLAGGQAVALVGHHGSGMTNKVQTAVLEILRENYPGSLAEFMFYVQPPKDKHPGEQSMRSRSLLFLSLGLAVASALNGGQPLVVAENGLISLNVPLTDSRNGSFSTRTTHPHFIALFRGLLTGLGISTRIETPYGFQTKGEMLVGAKNQDVLAKAVLSSMSCSHPEVGRYHGTGKNHCGYCVPCIIRRASMKAAGLTDATYDLDVLSKPPVAATATGSDLRAFLMSLERFVSAETYGSIFRVLSSGPLPAENVVNYAAVYRRGMQEVGKFLMPQQFADV